jgi:predicted TIM-barrel fold metal-dependent hydrolase
MIIDFHTHIFPDRIAERTISILSEKSGFTASYNGTVDGLVGEMRKANIDVAITLPVLTNPEQFESVLRFASSINESFAEKKKRLISFAGIHPRCEDIKGKMRLIKEKGFLGVKIHPDYQEAFIDDEGYIKILESAKELDLIVVTHSGVDGGYRDRPIRCTPERVKKVIDTVGHDKFVLAHFGANEMANEVFDILCGENVYFDTAFTLGYVSEDNFKRILDKHGADKILFATDAPWCSMKESIEILKSYNLDKTTEEKILSSNAKRLLGI